MFSATLRDNAAINYSPSNRELQEHLDYLRTHHFLRDEFLERRILSSHARRRRRRRRGRYAKMKKLTVEEVEKLFPKKLYAEWLHEGDTSMEEVLLVRVEVEDNHSVSGVLVPVKLPMHTAHNSTSDLAVVEMHEMHEMHDLGPRPHSDQDATSLAVLLGGKGELHFDSGSCAICLESYEDEEIVRGLVCGHVFHAECVDPWLTRRRACCPICKRDYYKEESNNSNEVREGSENEEDGNGESGNPASGAATSAAQEGDATEDNGAQTNGAEANGAEANGAEANDVDAPRTNATTYRPNEEDSINYDALRNDPSLQALLVELIPLSERVRVILDEHPELNMEPRGHEIADQKFGSFWKRIFWRIMGIRKSDLFNWAVIQIYQEERASQEPENAEDEDDSLSATPQMEQTTPVVNTETGSTTVGYQVASNVQSTEDLASPSRLATRSPHTSSNSPSPSIYDNTSMGEVDVSEALRRDIASRQV